MKLTTKNLLAATLSVALCVASGGCGRSNNVANVANAADAADVANASSVDWDDAPQSSVSDENSDVAWDANPAAGTRKVLTVDGVEYAFRYCPAGTFTMGSPEDEAERYDNETLREVTLTRGFWTLETEVTQEMFEALIGVNPSWFSASGVGAKKVAGLDTSRFPVESVRWYDVKNFIAKLNAGGFAPEGFKFRLPTEAEWEYACRAGTTTPFSWGSSLNGDKANCNGNYPYGTSTEGAYLRRTTAVGSYEANPWGLYDMHGNVKEWCADWYDDYDAGPQTDPTGPKSGSRPVLRGGCWSAYAVFCRSAYRSHGATIHRSNDYGFRLVLGRDVDAASPIADEDAEGDEIALGEDNATSPQEEKTDVGAASQASSENSDVAWDANPAAGARKVLTVDGVEYAFRYCPAGTFTMGSPEDEAERCDNETQREVTLTRGFWTLETEVTQEMYEALTGANPSWFSASGYGSYDVDGLDTSRFPVERVSWKDAQKFIAKLNAGGFAPDGFEFRLPTEAEWEYACRAGTTTSFSWGSSLNGDKANCHGRFPYGTSTKGAFLERTTAVGSYEANPWGLYDMHGNVKEWCADWRGDYDAGPQTDPTGPTSGSFRVLCGGGWRSFAESCRSAYRDCFDPVYRGTNCGFRLVLGRDVDTASPIADEDAEGDEIALGEDNATSPQEPETVVGAASQASVSDENSDVAWDAAPNAGTRKVLTVNGVEYAFRYCPSGTFMMGGPESEGAGLIGDEVEAEIPQHMVELTNGFWMLETEVTQAMWKAVMGSNPSEDTSSKRNPVETVNWNDCQEFIKKLNSLGVAPKGFQFRLPSEAEWEYACRAGTTGPYAGASLNALGWYGDNSGGRTHEVGTKRANGWGLYDMHGNVSEWCADLYYDKYYEVSKYYEASNKVQNPINVTLGTDRVLRGGDWGSDAERCRSAYRTGFFPADLGCFYGFRLVLGRKL